MQACPHGECPNCCLDCESDRLGEALRSCVETINDPDADPMMKILAQSNVDEFKERLKAMLQPPSAPGARVYFPMNTRR